MIKDTKNQTDKVSFREDFSHHKKKSERKKDIINKKITKPNLHAYFIYIIHICFCNLINRPTNRISL